MKKIRFFFITFCMIIFIISLSYFSFAYPLIGHQFYGYAGSGSTVTAITGDNSFSATVNAEGYYGYDTVFFVDAASDDVDGAENGDTITFYLDDKEVTTYTFERAGVTKLDFADDLATAGDSDDDGLTDEDEYNIYGTDPTDTDTDNDGLSDGEEIDEGTDPNDTDSDDDGLTDYEEASTSGGSSKSKKKSTTTEEITGDTGCYHKWKCTSWSECAENEFQTRICFYTGNCTTEGNQSDTRQRCTYVPPEEEEAIPEIEETCFDGVQNQGERDVDCGGPCESCEAPPKVTEEPKTNWWYILLAIILLLLIISVILGYKYRDKLKPVWDKFISKFRKKPGAASPNQKFL